MSESTRFDEDPRQILAKGRMGGRQYLAVAIATTLNALDGFDVLSISFASPGIAKEWGVSRAALGLVLSMELIDGVESVTCPLAPAPKPGPGSGRPPLLKDSTIRMCV